MNPGSYLNYTFRCCQDIELNSGSTEHNTRDRSQMKRFDCKSKLSIRPSLDERTLIVSLCHGYHTPYKDIHMNSDVLIFVNTRVAFQTPSEIFQNLQSSGLPEIEHIVQHQVYYHWKQEDRKYWRRDNDQFTSGKFLLEELGVSYRHQIITHANIRALGIYIRASIDALSTGTKELAIDTTCGTNSTGMLLFAVLAEFDGTGAPVAHLFVEKGTSMEPSSPGTMTQVLDRFLSPLLESGFAPSFLGCDKDKSEINAQQQVWPSAKVQLCFWHAKRAIQIKLKESSRSDSLSNYTPGDAHNLIPSLEICWGSYPSRRPSRDHRFGSCQCESSNIAFRGHDRLEVCSIEERNVVLAIFSRHFNAHPKIPDYNGTLRTSDAIHRECASEIYLWCRARNYFRLWAYMYANWYRHDQWNLWTRSSNSEEIPVMKTTMIVESHWRRIKHDFIHRFNRRRIDMVIWILTSRSIPQSLNQMRAIRIGDHRKAVASWRKAFKQVWKQCQREDINPQSLNRFFTDPVRWKCGCEGFLLSRFLLCKHIVFWYEDYEDPIRFFCKIRRQRTSPFWTGEQLILRPEFRALRNDVQTSNDDESSVASVSDSDSDQSEGHYEEHLLTYLEEETRPTYNYPGFQATRQQAMDISNEQEACGNTRFVEKFNESNASNQNLVEEIQQLNNRHTLPLTWNRRRHPASMYYI